MSPRKHTKNREFGSLDMYTVIGGAGIAGVLIRQRSQSRPSVVSEEPLCLMFGCRSGRRTLASE
jgi:hypothetical protein